MFKLEFCRNYYKDIGCWPKASFSSNCSERVKSLYNRQEWEETNTHPLTTEDFRGFEFQKTFEYDMFVDATELLSDKSIIERKSAWTYEYDLKAYSTIYKQFLRQGPIPLKSAILSYLRQEKFDEEEIINVIQTFIIPED